MPIVAVLNLLIGACLKVECQISQERYDDSKVVAVGLDKVVTCYGRRVDVMLAKVAQQILPHNKNGDEKRKYFYSSCSSGKAVANKMSYFSNQEHVHRTVRVGHPMNNSAEQISCENANYFMHNTR